MYPRFVTLAVLALLFVPVALGAQQPERFAVTQFGVHGPDKYAYLGPGIQSMLVSRLTWVGKLEPMDAATLARSVPGPVASAGQAEKVRETLGVDYLVWGSTTILGDNASLDVNITGKSGRALAKQASMPLSELIPTLESVARDINTDLFERPAEGEAQAAGKGGRPASAVAQAGPDKANPLFQYEAGANDDGVWRSRSYPFTAEFMDVGDVDGDGRMEVVLAEQGRAHLMRIEAGELKPLESLNLPRRDIVLAMNLYDINADGKEELVFSAWRDERPLSFVVGMRDGKLALVRDDIKLHLSVLRLPPLYRKVLVAQDKGAPEIFNRSGVYTVSLEGPEPRMGAKVLTPAKGNLFNMAILPTASDHKIVVLDDADQLRTFSPTGGELARSEETYNGTGLGLETHDTQLLGMGRARERNREKWYYYVPMPMTTVDSDGDGEHELLVNRNISVAAQVFHRYRSFSQGEIHALKWDGVGLTTLWKTPRIKGAVMAYRLADADSDGSQDLCVLVSVSPGMSSARSLLMVYNMKQ